jgi:hypothetical protein
LDAVSDPLGGSYTIEKITEEINHKAWELFKKIESFGGTLESNYYKTVFSSIYKHYRPSIPLWLPQWSDTNGEPSATVLNVYKKEEH